MLEVNLLGTTLKNPVIAASGTFGFGTEYGDFYDVARLGGICTKGLTLREKYGNEGERLFETPAGLLNSIGLQNPGIPHFIAHELPDMLSLGAPIFANLGGNSEEDYLIGAEMLNDTPVDYIELNISCPNVKAGGMAYGIKANTAADIVSKVRNKTTKPLIVKLSPQAEDIVLMAQHCEAAGADALSLVNTFKGMAIDIYKKRPVFENISAGLSGPAVKPIALRMVYEVCKNVAVPVIGLGGITTWQDAVEFILAGATALQVGTANFIRPTACIEIIEGLERYLKEENITSLDEIRGIA